MIKLICAICGQPADKINWFLTSEALPKAGIFKKEDLIDSAATSLSGHCPNCKDDFPINGDWNWELTGKAWKDFEDNLIHVYEFGGKQE